MARKPNYGFERREREKQKAAKKAKKAQAKLEKAAQAKLQTDKSDNDTLGDDS